MRFQLAIVVISFDHHFAMRTRYIIRGVDYTFDIHAIFKVLPYWATIEELKITRSGKKYCLNDLACIYLLSVLHYSRCATVCFICNKLTNKGDIRY